jgi:hypothetical protein
MARSSRSTFSSLLAAALLLRAAPAAAQACCAGSGAVTPARLGLHEDALVGLQLKNGYQLGSYDRTASYVATPSGTGEMDFEQDVFGAVRVLDRGQFSVLVPYVETYRRVSGESETGGGLGDINAAVRYDLLVAGQARLVPGVGLLAGVTLPSGTPPEQAQNALATDATGIGAFQGNGGVALEQAFGAWLVGLSGIVAVRAPRTIGRSRVALAPQYTVLGSAGYAFKSGVTAAGVLSYALEGDASLDGVKQGSSGKRLATVSAATAIPLSDELRFVASLYLNPPISSLGENQIATVGLTVGMIGAHL